jgi:hypothetical protein
MFASLCREALLCYQNAMVAFSKKGVRIGKDIDFVRSRMEALAQYVSVVGVKPFAQHPGMPLLREGWATLVPLHIRKRQPNPGTPLLTLNQCSSFPMPDCPMPNSALATYPPPPASLIPASPLGPTMGAVGYGYFMPPAPPECWSNPPQREKKVVASILACCWRGSTVIVAACDAVTANRGPERIAQFGQP